MRWAGIAYRAHDPRWSWAPLSGEGARLKGGHFNRPGTATLYLALTIEGMFLEMGHGFAHRFEPLTACSYDVDMDGLVDLRDDPARAAADVRLADLACPGALDRAEGRTPAAWVVADRLLATGASGILVPSFARGARPDMANLVLWRWGDDLPHRVRVYDPNGKLPPPP